MRLYGAEVSAVTQTPDRERQNVSGEQRSTSACYAHHFSVREKVTVVNTLLLYVPPADFK